MAITKTGANLAVPSFGRQVLNYGVTHPIALGVTGLSVGMGGDSVGESVGAGLAGAAGFLGTQRLLPHAADARSGIKSRFGAGSTLSRAANALPGWLRPVGRVAAGLAGGVAASEVGRNIGSHVPIWQREQQPQEEMHHYG